MEEVGSGVPEWVNQILIASINKRASDIHFEPTGTNLIIRIRVDGLLQVLNFASEIDTPKYDSVASRIKVLAQMNITEHRFPQDGHFELEYSGRHYNFRVSTMPTNFGETIVMRILKREDEFTTIDKLGLLDNQLEILRKLISGTSGMILTTGPTGSGKTSLLYSIVKAMSRTENAIVTLEDPIEYEMENIRQVQVNDVSELTFAKAMRAVLRQDPNYIMLGEIRDAETVQIAVQAALSGISIISTFHTFDVPFLVTRFIEMGISASIIAQVVRGVISTRLIRTICPNCKESYQLNDREKLLWGNRPVPAFMHGRGCEKCVNTGFFGRTGIFEIIPFDTDFQAGIIQRQPPSYFYKLIKDKNILSLREAGYLKVAQGITTLTEVTRVLGYL